MTPASFRACLLLLPALLAGIASATPREDLASPDPAVRDQAAAEIRRTFVPTPESKWAPVMAKIQKGQTSEEILALFPTGTEINGPGSSGPYEHLGFRLDDEWTFAFAATHPDRRVVEWSLIYDPLAIDPQPPAHFTGLWTTYYLNGNKSREIECLDGKGSGNGRNFYPNGLCRTAITASPDGSDYDQTDYSIEGLITNRSIRKHDDPIEVTISYDAFGETDRRLHAVDERSRPTVNDENSRRILIAQCEAQREVVKRAEDLAAAAARRFDAAPAEEREKLAIETRLKRERVPSIVGMLTAFETWVERSEQAEAQEKAQAQAKEAALQAVEASKAAEAEKAAKSKKKSTR